jgi:hypothetical protein
MKKVFSIIPVTLIAMSAAAHATTLGIPGSLGSSAFWDTFVDSVPGPPSGPLVFTNAAPGTSDTSAFSATLSANMAGGVVSGAGDRIYNGNAALSAAFNLTLNGTVTASITTLTLVVKSTNPDPGTGLTYTDFFNIQLDGQAATTITFSGTTSESFSGQVMGVTQYTWTGLNLAATDTFAITITSPDSGHVSVDGIQLSQGVVPEPTAAALIGLGAVTMLLRRRR